MAYLELRRNTWHALQDIPKDVRPHFNGLRKFCQSLKTDSRQSAERRKVALELKWKKDIAEARKGSPLDPRESDIAFWKQAYQSSNEEHRGLIVDSIVSEFQPKMERAARLAGVGERDDEGMMTLPEYAETKRIVDIVTGATVAFAEHLEDWLGTLDNEQKSKDMKRSTIKGFAGRFPYVSDVRKKDVQVWANDLAAKEKKKPATIRRAFSELRGYWSYLQSLEVVPDGVEPFHNPKISAAGISADDKERKPFKPADVAKLLIEAEAKQDHQLADLIRLDMWTGARLESLCSLKITEVDLEACSFEILSDKTEAGQRIVPIHSKLLPTMKRLVEASADGFVLPGLTLNLYGDRSNAIGKRFGRLKTDQGFGAAHVFHSIRKTVATLLDNAGIPEKVAADIVGHDVVTLTYGLYSGGSSPETMKAAIEKIDYPGYVSH